MINMELDIISCLPDHLIDLILSHLPIKEAVRTSVLSSKWRMKWSTLPDLVFDSQCVSTATSQDPSVIESKFLRIVDHVLLLHSGPVNKFEVSADSFQNLTIGVNSMADIDRWIFHISERYIKEFVLDIMLKPCYKMPCCLFSCQSLQHLELNYCCLNPPTTFEGFRKLKSLSMFKVTMTQDAFENMIPGCHLLEKLTLQEIDGLTQINIHAPNLKCLDILGQFESINFDDTLQLALVSVILFSKGNQIGLHGCSSNLLKFFVHLPQIHNLFICQDFLKYLAAGIVPVKLPKPCINLRIFRVCINFNDLKKISVVLCLLNSSPNLRILNLYGHNEKENALLTPVSCCWEDIFSEPSMPLGVQHMMIDGISGTKSELHFIQFLLLYSPVLEKMIVNPIANVRTEVMKKLIRFKRASRQAEVIYYGELPKDFHYPEFEF